MLNTSSEYPRRKSPETNARALLTGTTGLCGPQEEGVHQLTVALTEVEAELAQARAEAAEAAAAASTSAPSPPKEVMVQAAMEAVRKQHAAFRGEQEQGHAADELQSRVAALEELAGLQEQELDVMRRADDAQRQALAALETDRNRLAAALVAEQGRMGVASPGVSSPSGCFRVRVRCDGV